MAISTIPGAGITSSTTLTTPIVATTLGVGGATPSASGAGITFPATQSASTNANTLDDYEEGTWTPTDASGAGLTFNVQSARYLKIGSLCFVSGYLDYPSTASGSFAQIGGLPFTAIGSNSYFYTAGRCGYTGMQFTWQIQSAGNVLEPKQIGGSGIPTNSNLTSQYVIFSGSYITSS